MVLLTIAFSVVLLATFGLLFVRLASRVRAPGLDAEWLDSFSLESYHPMQRLLDPADLAFLASQPGYRPEIGRRLLAERRKIFAEYLSLLIGDFHRLLAIARLMMVYSSEDREEFGAALWRQQLRFYRSVCVVRCRLVLSRFGWRGVNVGGLVDALEAMRDRVQLSAARSAEAS